MGLSADHHLGDSPCLARTCRMACVLMAFLVVASYQLAPAHAAPSAPVPELAPPDAAAFPADLFNSTFPHLAAPAAARHSGTSIRSAGEEAPAPLTAEEESALAPRSQRESLLPVQCSHCRLLLAHRAAPYFLILPVGSLQLTPPCDWPSSCAETGSAPVLSQHPLHTLRPITTGVVTLLPLPLRVP